MTYDPVALALGVLAVIAVLCTAASVDDTNET